ncbi:MAG TPA: Crp/Fnr family transcriptional regulator [Solirubrobacteraceae bacterium]|nr:Crp/Fnr family transcriptional regulator [Solirubrobacteraceae bacterium]
MNGSDLGAAGMIRLLDIDPDLAGTLEPAQLEMARASSQAVVLDVLGPGWDPDPVREMATAGWLGLYVVSGLMIRVVHVGRRMACELFGPGDVFRPWDADGEYEPLSIDLSWRIARPARVAVMDTRFAQSIARWPTITSSLMQRLATRARILALGRAVAQIPRADTRLLITFWLLAERWGRMGPEGISITLPLTHETLAMIIGVQRPTVTLALRRLSDAGLLTRPKRDCWVLTRDAIDHLQEDESVDLLIERFVLQDGASAGV